MGETEMTEREALKLALEALQKIYIAPEHEEYIRVWWPACEQAIPAIKEALAQPEQEPVAMKFKIYKPTVPDPMKQGINNALLPWVHDQDRSSGFDASMWVTPVATLPPQRKPLTDEEIKAVCAETWSYDPYVIARAIEAAHGIKENK